MEALFPFIIVLGLLAVLAVLFMGVTQLFRGGDPRRSNRLMRWRVILQLGVIVLIVLFTLIARK